MRKYSLILENHLFRMVNLMSLDSGLTMGEIVNGILELYYMGIIDKNVNFLGNEKIIENNNFKR